MPAAPIGRGRASEQLVDEPDDDLRLERFGQHAVAAGLVGLHLIDRLERTGQQQHRDVREARLALDVAGDLVAVPAGHPDIREDDVGRLPVEHGNRLIAIADGDNTHILIGKRQLDDALDGHTVVGEEKDVRHFGGIGDKHGYQ